MNPVLQEILHNITSRLAALEQAAQSDKLLIDLIQEQRTEIDRLRAAQPEQEPIAWLVSDAQGRYATIRDPASYGEEKYEPLYVAPPRKPWVGLTNLDMPTIRDGDHAFWAGAQFADAWLKEKNT